MVNIKSRLAALEEAAARAARLKPHISTRSIEESLKRLNEILARPASEKTQEEVIADFKAYALQHRADWELRHAQS